MIEDLDEVDRGILHLLQEDARNHSAPDMAAELDVSANTVRNRINRLVSTGVIQGYSPHIDYERSGYQLRVLLVCTVPVSDRSILADEALGVEGVIRVTEIHSGHENLYIDAVAEDSENLTSIATQLEERGISIRQELFVKTDRVQPFNHFGVEVIEE